MTDWIKHVPGDPMPVDGETVVQIMTRGGMISTERPAIGFLWDDMNYGLNITAYRIHKKEREMKYKAGDRVTIELTEEGADDLNTCEVDETSFKIVGHQPASEPIVRYAALLGDDMVGGFEDLSKCKGIYKGAVGFAKITYHPATKEVKAEVVG